MASVTVSAQGQVTLGEHILQHLGIRPGDSLEVERLPQGKAALHAAKPRETVEAFIGLLKGRTKKIATLQDLDEAAANGWAESE